MGYLKQLVTYKIRRCQIADKLKEKRVDNKDN